jgi:signal recognition particle subunit SRP19
VECPLRKLDNRVIVWPIYFDSSKSKAEGRKLPKRFAVESPKLDEIIYVARLLNLNPEPNFGARFSRCWWQETGYLVVDKVGSKNKTLIALANKIIELRKLNATSLRKV